MTEEKYLKEKEELLKKNEIELNNLAKIFVLENRKFNLGDMIRDHRWAFIVDRITVSKLTRFPEPVYHGFELKKDLTPRKDKNRVAIYGNDAELIINK